MDGYTQLMTNINKRLKPILIVAALGTLALAYLALAPDSKAPPPDTVKTATPTGAAQEQAPEVKKVVKAVAEGASPAGNYLAGHHAEAIGETGRALDFYGHASKDQRIATAGLYSRMYVLGLTQGDLDKALLSLNQAETLGAKAPLSDLSHAVTAMKMGDYDQVISLLSKDGGGISQLLSPTLIAWAEMGKGDLGAALAALDTMKDNDKVQPMRFLHTALIQDFSKEEAAAAVSFKALQGQSGLSLRTVQLMGTNLERRGLAQEALALYEASSSGVEAEILIHEAQARMDTNTRPLLDVDSPKKGAAEALYGISTVLLVQGSWESALALANMALHLRPDFPEAAMIAAGAMEQNRRIEDANQVYATIPNSSPLSWLAQRHMANNYDRLDQTDKAIKLLRAMADAHPIRERPLIELADILRSHERFDEAITVYSEALTRVPTPQAAHWGVFYARGICYEQTKQWPKAEADFIQALALQPDQPMVLNYLGYSWIDKGLHLKKALQMIRKAVELRPRDGYIVDSLGWGLYRMGDYKQAVKRLERATMLRPADPLINDHLGDALWQIGRFREAKFQWQRSLDLDPKSDIVDIVRQKLKHGLTTGQPTSSPETQNTP